MKIRHDYIDKDHYFDILITEDDCNDILSGEMVQGAKRIQKNGYHFGILLNEEGDEDAIV